MFVQSANLALRFGLELCARGALGYWPLRSVRALLPRVSLAVAAPLLAAVVWGVFVSPKAPVAVPGPLHLGLQLAILGAASAGLYATDHPRLALAFALVALANGALMAAWGQ